jgi:KDO2-lipid IV(A) lauroyltransferase
MLAKKYRSKIISINNPFTGIYRTLDSALLDRLVFKVRSTAGNVPLAKEHAMRNMLRTLKRNGMLGILIDQNVDWYEGVFVDFFGRPACTTDGLALLALHTEAPVLPGYMVRLPDGRYRLVIGPEVEIVRTGDKDADVLANTQRFTEVIEETVRRYPDQWLWIHQRWKTKRCQIPHKE